MAKERVAESEIVAARPSRVARVHTHIGQEQIEQTVAVIVEKHRAGGVAYISDAGLRRDVAKRAVAEVFEEPIPVAHRRDEEVGIAVVVDVGEGASHRDRVRQFQPRRDGDVHEPTAAQVLPEFVGAELGDEVEIGETIAIDVRGAQSAPVVVVRELVGFARVVDDPVLEGDAAGLPPIREPEVVEHA